MLRLFAFTLSALIFLVSCAAPPPAALGPDGKPLPRVYKITERDTGEIQYRMLDAINELRAAVGAQPVQLNAQLNAAASTHSRDMSVQNRAWHFGSDGSSMLDRVARTGFAGQPLGENISETYETELVTLGAWMDDAATRPIIMDRRAANIGFAWYQEPNGKIWWTLVTGT